jgi:hypothetical protein
MASANDKVAIHSEEELEAFYEVMQFESCYHRSIHSFHQLGCTSGGGCISTLAFQPSTFATSTHKQVCEATLDATLKLNQEGCIQVLSWQQGALYGGVLMKCLIALLQKI